MTDTNPPTGMPKLPEGTNLELQYCHLLPNAPGFKLVALKVSYAPGASTPRHRHGNAFVSAVVLKGRVQSGLNDGAIEEFGAGDNWTENPGDIHSVSRNASETEPAEFIATFVCPVDQNDFVIFDCPACEVVKNGP